MGGLSNRFGNILRFLWASIEPPQASPCGVSIRLISPTRVSVYFLRLTYISPFFMLYFHALSQPLISFIYSTTDPFGKLASVMASDKFPSGPSPDKIIPSDNSPRNLTGFKFVTQITFLPI